MYVVGDIGVVLVVKVLLGLMVVLLVFGGVLWFIYDCNWFLFVDDVIFVESEVYIIFGNYDIIDVEWLVWYSLIYDLFYIVVDRMVLV